MNVQEYISSGIVESYVLGLASVEDQAEFERMCKQYPEVLEARISFERALENHARQHAVSPPAALRQEVINAALRSETSVIPPKPGAAEGKAARLRYVAAACAVLLAASLFWNISQYNRTRKLQNSYNELTRDYDTAAFRLEEMADEIAMLRANPNVKMAAMKGMPASPASFATVLWDTVTRDVYLVINNLPQPATGKQYQLWALLDGRPSDIGMIDNNYFIDEKRLLLRMKNASKAEAFAITLEKEGGVPQPEGAMYVMGRL